MNVSLLTESITMMMTLQSNLVLDAPLKDFIYVAGSFNNAAYKHFCHEKDPASGKFGWN
jgi:hypothetical protein